MTDFFYIQVPADVKILLLSGTSLNKNQLDQVQKCTNILKLDLSNCNLSLIPNLKKLTNLRILYLHQNQISSLSVEPILGCNQLNYLTLFLNPVSAQCSLRRQVISYCSYTKQLVLWNNYINSVIDNYFLKSHFDFFTIKLYCLIKVDLLFSIIIKFIN